MLAAIESIVAALPDFETVGRNVDWQIDRPELPAAAILDGPERAEDQDVFYMLVTTAVAIDIILLSPIGVQAASQLHEKMGVVLLALYADPTLGGVATRVRYVGCDQPDAVNLQASPTEAVLRLNIEVTRLERQDTPFA